MSSPFRKPLTLASVVAVGSLAALGGAGTATASHPGSPSTSVLTATSTNNTQIVGLSKTLTPADCDGVSCTSIGVHDAQWSPDGSRAVFVGSDLAIRTVRFDNEEDTWFVSFPDDGVQARTSPSYRGTGGSVVWAEQLTGGHWYIALDSSSCCYFSDQISPSGSTDDYTDPDGGPDTRIVAERNGTEVVLWDGTGTADANWTKIADGTDPAFSPDGTQVAYAFGGQIWKANLDGSGTPSQLTSDASAAYANPTWSADGTTIAFNSGTDIRTVSSGGGATTLTALTGTPAYQSRLTNLASRLAGADRYHTAAAVSGSYWKTKGDAGDMRHEAKSVVLSRSDTFADALGGSSLAAAKEGPLLLTPTTVLDATTGAEIDRVLDAGDTVYLLGGTAAISSTVENAIKAMGYTTVRVAGADRYSTAIAIANQINANPDLILVATGNNFPDALGAGAAAGSYDVPGASDLKAVVVLTADKVLPSSTKAYLDSHGGDIFTIGGQADAAAAGYGSRVFSLAGADRYETAYFVSATFFASQHEVGVATGNDWPDALAGGALMGTLNGPLVLTPGTSASTDIATTWALSDESASVSTVLVFGGTGVVTDNQLKEFGRLISGPAGYTIGSAVFQVSAVSGTSLRSSTPVAGSDVHKTLDQIKASIKVLQEQR